MYKDHDQLEPITDNIILWKYMDLLKFVNILTSKSIWFNRIDEFEDVYEGVYSLANKEIRATIYDEPVIPQHIYDIAEDFTRSHLYVLCWHNSSYESAAMWKLYARDSGVAVKTNGKRLKECFLPEMKEIYVSPVSYIDYEKDFLPEGNLFYLGTHKRKSFEHEKEIRCMYLNQKEIIKEPGVYINIDVAKLIEEVYISPYAPPYMEDTVNKLLKQFNLDVPVILSPLLKAK